MCALPYKYRNRLEMLLKLMKVRHDGEQVWMILTPCPYDPIMGSRFLAEDNGHTPLVR